jgi:hypothetical protein
MTSGFEQQEPLANRGFIRSVVRPQQVGVQLPREPKPAPPAAPGLPSEQRTF